MRCDPLLFAGLCLLSGALWVSAGPALGCTVLIAALLGWRAVARPVLAVGVLLLGLSAWRASERAAQYAAHYEWVRQRLPQPERCAVEVIVASSPVVRDGNASFTAELLHAECEQLVLTPGWQLRLNANSVESAALGRGDRVAAVVQVSLVSVFRNHGLADPLISLARKQIALRASVLSLDEVNPATGLRRSIDRARGHVRARIEATFAPAAHGMAKALVLGENDLSAEEDAAFKASGLAHLLAVSGTHLVFAVVSLVAALRALLVRVRVWAEAYNVARFADAVGVLLALVYADFAGGSGSAWRAAWMLSASLGVRALQREASASRCVAASLLVGWGYDPLAVYDVSFMLSAAATFGLLTLGRYGTARLSQWELPRGVRLAAEGLIATLSSMLPCSVLLAMLSADVSLMGIVANVLAAPFGETVALPLCLAHALLAPLPWVEQGTAWVASGALLVVRRLALAVGNSAWLRVEVPYPSDWQVALVVLGLLAPFLMRAQPSFGNRPRLGPGWVVTLAGLFAFCALEWAQVRAGAPHGRLRFTALDVGQGDATLVDLPGGQLLLVDAGGVVGSPQDPGGRVVLPVLRARRRSHVDVVVLSHPHPDHFGGLQAVLSRVSVGELWDTGQGELEGAGPAYRQVLQTARARGVAIRRPDTLCGVHTLGEANIQVLGPCPAITPNANANDNSFVLRVSFGQRALLLTGDAEHAQEQHLVSTSAAQLRSDLLKVGHHGSRTSSSAEFLHWVSPAVATVSCGRSNRFGHPHAAALGQLGHRGALVYRTDVSGSIIWQTDGDAVAVRTFQD